MRLIRIQLDRAGQEATPPPPPHNTCTNILQLFQVVKIRGNTGLLWRKTKRGCWGKAFKSCRKLRSLFKSF